MMKYGGSPRRLASLVMTVGPQISTSVASGIS